MQRTSDTEEAILHVKLTERHAVAGAQRGERNEYCEGRRAVL